MDELTVEKFKEEHFMLPLEACIIHSDSTTVANNARRECVHYLEATTLVSNARRARFEEHGKSSTSLIPSIQEGPKLKLKELPSHLRYAYLGENSTLPVIISISLTCTEEEKLLRVLCAHKSAIGWIIADIKG